MAEPTEIDDEVYTPLQLMATMQKKLNFNEKPTFKSIAISKKISILLKKNHHSCEHVWMNVRGVLGIVRYVLSHNKIIFH